MIHKDTAQDHWDLPFIPISPDFLPPTDRAHNPLCYNHHLQCPHLLPTFTLAWLCSCCSPCPECPFALLPSWIYPSKSDSRVWYADSPFLSSQIGLVMFFPGPPKHLASAFPLLWFTPLWIVLVYVFIFFTFFYKLLEVLSHHPETVTISLGLATAKWVIVRSPNQAWHNMDNMLTHSQFPRLFLSWVKGLCSMRHPGVRTLFPTFFMTICHMQGAPGHVGDSSRLLLSLAFWSLIILKLFMDAVALVSLLVSTQVSAWGFFLPASLFP